MTGLWGCQRTPKQESISLIANPTARPIRVQADEVEHPTIALVMKTLTNPFFAQMEQGARQAESELGVQLLVQTAAQETSIEQQIGIIDNLIQKKVQAIVIAPGDSIELIPILKKAQDAGIVIVNIDNRLDPRSAAQLGLTDVPFVGVHNQQGAYLSAKVISEQIRKPSQVAIIEGIRTAQNAEDRKQGALQAFRKNPNVTQVVTETANWKIDEANRVTRLLFEHHPDVKAIFCANDMMALGTIEYLKESQRHDVLVAGYDALDDAKQAIKSGDLAATVDQQAQKQGYLGVKYAVQVLKGESVPPETLVPVRVVQRKDLSP